MGKDDDVVACRIVVLDSRPVLRRGLASLLARVPLNVRECSNLTGLTLERTDILVVGDYRSVVLRPCDIGACQVVGMGPADAACAIDALRSGCCCYISHDASEAELIAGVEASMQKERYVDGATMHRVLDSVLEHRGSVAELVFSEREHDVMALTAQGLRGKEIADRLSLSPKTVATYLARLRAKTGTHSTAQLVAYALTTVRG